MVLAPTRSFSSRPSSAAEAVAGGAGAAPTAGGAGAGGAAGAITSLQLKSVLFIFIMLTCQAINVSNHNLYVKLARFGVDYTGWFLPGLLEGTAKLAKLAKLAHSVLVSISILVSFSILISNSISISG
jgi:hypothetical protein